MEKKIEPLSKSNRLRIRIALSLTVCLAAGLVYKYWFGPPSPEQVRDRTLHALETGNAEELCRLADPEELQKLNFTPQSVEAALRETIWAQGYPHLKKCSVFTLKPADRRVWLIEWQGAAHKHYLGMTVMDDLHVGWRINLSSLLRGAYYQDRDFGASSAAYKSKFNGLRTDGGDYKIFDAPKQ